MESKRTDAWWWCDGDEGKTHGGTVEMKRENTLWLLENFI
jgi:hypothetical protein